MGLCSEKKKDKYNNVRGKNIVIYLEIQCVILTSNVTVKLMPRREKKILK